MYPEAMRVSQIAVQSFSVALTPRRVAHYVGTTCPLPLPLPCPLPCPIALPVARCLALARGVSICGYQSGCH